MRKTLAAIISAAALILTAAPANADTEPAGWDTWPTEPVPADCARIVDEGQQYLLSFWKVTRWQTDHYTYELAAQRTFYRIELKKKARKIHRQARTIRHLRHELQQLRNQ